MIFDITTSASRRANFKKEISPKSLRYAYASYFAMRGVSTSVLKSIMGLDRVDNKKICMAMGRGAEVSVCKAVDR